MKNTTVCTGILSGLVLGAALVAACSSGSSNSTPTGMAAIVLRDGTVQSSDGRTVTSVFVEVSRITLKTAEADDDDHDDDGNRENDDGDDDDGDHDDGDHDGGTEVVVFDMFLDNGGVPREIDLLTLTNSGVLFNMLRIPVGTYDEGTVTIIGASAIFEDDPTQTPVTLAIAGDDGSDSEFDFDFHPPVVVTTAVTSIAAIDIVPVITLDNGVYTLSHDDDSDHSGGCGDDELEIEVEGTISAVDGDTIHLGNFGLEIDLSLLGPMLLVPGMEVEVSGFFDNGVFVAQELEIED
jgi:hypothetical protein